MPSLESVPPRVHTPRRAPHTLSPRGSAGRKLLVRRQQAAHPLRLGGHLGLHLRWLRPELGSGKLPAVESAARRLTVGAAHHGSGCGNDPTRGGGSDGKDKRGDHRPKRRSPPPHPDDARWGMGGMGWGVTLPWCTNRLLILLVTVLLLDANDIAVVY